MKLIHLMFVIPCFLFAFGCARDKGKDKPKTTRVSIISNTGLKMFSATSEGPFRIEIEGADVSIKLLKEETDLTKKIEKAKK